MRTFTDEQVFERLKLATTFTLDRKKQPLIVGIQSIDQNISDDFVDKFFLFDKNNNFVCSATGTTRTGKTVLKNFINKRGACVWKTDEFYSDCFKYGLHQGRMKCLRLSRNIKIYRDQDKDNIHEEQGALSIENPACNFHGVSYETLETNEKIVQKIGRWSEGCQVCNNMKEYRAIIKFVYENGGVADYAILKEWDKNEITT